MRKTLLAAAALLAITSGAEAKRPYCSTFVWGAHNECIGSYGGGGETTAPAAGRGHSAPAKPGGTPGGNPGGPGHGGGDGAGNPGAGDGGSGTDGGDHPGGGDGDHPGPSVDGPHGGDGHSPGCEGGDKGGHHGGDQQ